MTHLNIRVYGIVQGVGFRPFVSRLAARAGLTGNVCNRGSFVEIHVQGGEDTLEQFQKNLRAHPPARALILKLDVKELPAEEYDGFHIITSKHRAGDIFVSPDIAICPTCKEELFQQKNRRYLHPFINCTDCGPRLTILKQMPYDRSRTTMSEFPMCARCRREYETMGNRRYDAQPVCCNDCGPQVYLLGEEQVRGQEAIRRTREVIKAGGIAAVKGIGGFHLCCDAGNEEAVRLLRRRKHRPAKPFAVMAKDMETARKICRLTPEAEQMLDGVQKPILIGRKREKSSIAESVAPDNPGLGVMLPYAPLQLLLFQNPDDVADFPPVLVMTSGNRGGAPICRNDEQVRENIGELCDIVLSHNREILIRADDSVVEAMGGEPFMLRRSRGYAPLPFAVSLEWTGQVLAVGGELKNTFCIGKDGFFYPSPYVGDIGDVRSRKALEVTVKRMLELFECRPQAVVCDSHPLYQSSAFAKTLGLPVYEVQHHYAHVLSLLAEHDITSESVIGVAFDGTGYGSDGSIWGGEFLVADLGGFQRMGALDSFTQIGGDAAATEGWRIAVSLLIQQFGAEQALAYAKQLDLCDGKVFELLLAARAQGISCVKSTSAGRFFDAVSAILGLRRCSTFEGEAAQTLQYAAQAASSERMAAKPETLAEIRREREDFFSVDMGKFLDVLCRERAAGMSAESLARLFHETLAAAVCAGCEFIREKTGLSLVGLTGGCFSNRLLTELTCEKLSSAGFRVLTHRQVPAGDGGIALGQALYGMCRLQNIKESGKR